MANALIEAIGTIEPHMMVMLSRVDEFSYFGVAAVRCVIDELAEREPFNAKARSVPLRGPDLESPLAQYLNRRLIPAADELPDLPIPTEFRKIFRDWAEGRIDFVEFLAGESNG